MICETKFDLDLIFNDMGLTGEAREATKTYMNRLFREYGESSFDEKMIYIMAGAFYDGHYAGVKWLLHDAKPSGNSPLCFLRRLFGKCK